MELGPLQKKWIAALRSGEYKQITGKLSRNGGYCCLGLANKVCELGENEEENNGGLGKTYRLIGLKNPFGINSGEENKTLTMLNDKFKKGFEEIADILEKNPEDYFTEPK